jgi:hypothetical protein
MGVIINPRGPSGSGKTEFARRIFRAYGGPPLPGGCGIVSLFRHPNGGRPLAVVGSYGRTSGGCDAIRLVDGGIDTAFRSAAEWAARGFDVLMEGNRMNVEVERTLELARDHPLVVISLATPEDRCAANLLRRQRLGRDALARLARRAAAERAVMGSAIAGLGTGAMVFEAGFERAFELALSLLGAAPVDDGRQIAS